MTSAQTAASERRAWAAQALAQAKVPFRMEYGFWTLTTADGEEHPDLTVSHVEWYLQGLRDGAARVARSIPPMDTR